MACFVQLFLRSTALSLKPNWNDKMSCLSRINTTAMSLDRGNCGIISQYSYETTTWSGNIIYTLMCLFSCLTEASYPLLKLKRSRLRINDGIPLADQRLITGQLVTLNTFWKHIFWFRKDERCINILFNEKVCRHKNTIKSHQVVYVIWT